MSTREEVFEAISSEREYQDRLWNASTTPTEGKHTVDEFILYMDLYIQRAKELASTLPAGGGAPEGKYSYAKPGETALDFVRKVTTLGVACMEQNGAPSRD